MRAAIYARVSTKERQEVGNQLRQLREFAAAQGWTIFRQYVDHETGKTDDRGCDFQQFVAGMATLCFKQGWALSGLTIATQANEVQAKCPSSSRCLIMEPNRDIASSMKTRRSGEFRGNPRLSANLTRAMDG